MTKKVKADLEKKLESLRHQLNDARFEVTAANDHGTWHDNFSFEQAQQTREFLEGQVNDLAAKLKKAVITQPNRSSGPVDIGHAITINNQKETKTYTIVGIADSDAKNNLVSYASPIGLELVGKKHGEKVSLIDGTSWKITKIAPGVI
ncbi:GreA/GreB family elongation factor [Candidatus Microgenomates bacterium]|nr:GreA/GreB family elongation factor [Candidatus Microgenomates bacterium]